MLKSTTNADCPYFLNSKQLCFGYHRKRAALHKEIKVIKELIDCHDCASFLICCDTLYTRPKNLSSAF